MCMVPPEDRPKLKRPYCDRMCAGARLLLRHKPYHTDPDAVVVVRKDNGEELAWISRKNTDDFKGLGTTPATFVWAGRIGHGPRCVVVSNAEQRS